MNPIKPDIDYSYAGFEQENQDGPFPGTQLDNDLANLVTSASQTIDALADIRRADGALNNGIVTADSLDESLLIGLSTPEPWETSHRYVVLDCIVSQEPGLQGVYRCAVSHESADFSDDLAAGYWELIFLLSPDGLGLAPVAISGAYVDLTGKPTLGTAAAQNVDAFMQPGDYDPQNIKDDVFAFANMTGVVNAATQVDFNRLWEHDAYVQRRLGECFYGFTGKSTGIDDQIYPFAQNAVQDHEYDPILNSLFQIQRCSAGSTNWTIAERCRILIFPVPSGGAIVNAIEYTPELQVGHGAGLSIRRQGLDVYFYTTARTVTGHELTDAGKGFSKVQWKGASTTQGDVQDFQLMGYIGSGHPLQDYNRANVCLGGENNELIILLATRTTNTYGAEDKYVLIWNRAAVEAAADPLTVAPLWMFPLDKLPPLFGASVQSIYGAKDHLIISLGSGAPFGYTGIHVLTYAGDVLADIPFEQENGYYGATGIYNNPTLGYPLTFEVEGITIGPRGYPLITILSQFQTDAGATLVSYEGKYYQCRTANTGVSPRDPNYWVPTLKTAGAVAWTSATIATIGTYTTVRSKVIYEIAPMKGLADEKPANSGLISGLNPLGGEVQRNNSTFRTVLNEYFNFVGTSPNTGESKLYAGLTARGLYMHDAREGADSSKESPLRVNFLPGFEYVELTAMNGQSGTGNLRVYGANDPTYPGEVRATGTLSASVAGTQDSIQAFRAGVKKFSTYASGAITQVVADGDSHLTLSLRTLAGAASGPSAYWAVNQTLSATVIDATAITGDLLPFANDTYSLGSVGRRIKKVWATALSLFPAASVTPATNGEMVFQLTSNTALAIKVKGSDGTVRTGTITLA